ncbi:MAG TPA: hypothetical protein VKG80_13815 [Trebonia sp.]|nr:hypothetical protein [Trebonia sp.]
MTVYSIWGQAAESFTTTGFTGTLATDFNLSTAAQLTGIWVYSPSGATPLPTACAIYDVGGSSVVSGTLNSSPSWSGAAGAGWVKCTYSGPTLNGSAYPYAVAVYYSATVAFQAYTWPANPNIIDATAASYSTTAGSISFPGTSAGAYTYWIDVEVTVTAAAAEPAPYLSQNSGMF